MSEPRRLSTCARCGGTVERYHSELYRQLRWRHVKPTVGHDPDPDDGYVATEEEG